MLKNVKIMKFSAIKRNVKDTFSSVMGFFSDNFFGNDWEGNDFFHDFGNFLDTTKFPTDKIVLNPFDYVGKFEITFKYNGERVCWYRFSMDKSTKVLEIDNNTYEHQTIRDMFSGIIRDWVKQYNAEVFRNKLKECGMDIGNVSVSVDEYTDYKRNGRTQIIEGTLSEVFDTYTTHNDRLKYVNGSYWGFSDKKVDMLYGLFIRTYGGNYFLDNAVRRGVTID